MVVALQCATVCTACAYLTLAACAHVPQHDVCGIIRLGSKRTFGAWQVTRTLWAAALQRHVNLTLNALMHGAVIKVVIKEMVLTPCWAYVGNCVTAEREPHIHNMHDALASAMAKTRVKMRNFLETLKVLQQLG